MSSAVAFLAPYEAEAHKHNRPVVASHGGYGVVAEGYIVGPFFCIENARTFLGNLIGGRVVRWIDFVRESTQQHSFTAKLLKRTEPMTVKIRGYLNQVSIYEENPKD